LVVAYLAPKVSVQVAGNRLNISPHVKKINPVMMMNMYGARPNSLRPQCASAPNENTIAIVFSRPMTSEIQPKKAVKDVVEDERKTERCCSHKEKSYFAVGELKIQGDRRYLCRRYQP
jgi:hypothetical protein